MTVSISDREAALRRREAAVALREKELEALIEAQLKAGERQADVQEANQRLVIASLKADEMTDAANTTRRRQDEFLAMLAHELRNPLAPIRSAAVLLAQHGNSDATLTLIREVIERQVEHMARLLDDLLDVSRVTSGKVKLQRRPTTVNEFINQGVEICHGFIDVQRQAVTVDVPATPLYVDGDPMRLAQVVGNLLHNASKYTQQGGAISVSARPKGDKVVIRVRDNGCGISAEAMPHIFDLFQQEDRSLSRSQGGMGIGLTIVRSMVELHGGSVDARSAGLGQGSEFIVTLPRTMPLAKPGVVPRAAAAAAPSRILLVDDNVDAGMLLAMLLRSSEHEVTIAVDGPSALATFEQMRPDVVLCDIGLPGMSGYEVTAAIRKLAQGAQPVIIALTGYDGPEYRARSLAAGFDHHVAKPVDFELLEAMIASSRPLQA